MLGLHGMRIGARLCWPGLSRHIQCLVWIACYRLRVACARVGQCLVICSVYCVVGKMFGGMDYVMTGVQCSEVPEVFDWGVSVVFVVELGMCSVWGMLLGSVCFVAMEVFVAVLGIWCVGVEVMGSECVMVSVVTMVVQD